MKNFIFVAESSLTTNITENKLAQLEDNPDLLKLQKEGRKDVMNVINEEAENFAVQHRVNKLKQHHRRAFELISRALKIDEEVGNKDERTVELYKKGKKCLQMLLSDSPDLTKYFPKQYNNQSAENYKKCIIDHPWRFII